MAPMVGSGMWFGSLLNYWDVFVSNGSSTTIQSLTYDPSTGVMTNVGTVATGATPVGVAVDPTNHVVFVANNGADTIQSLTYDPSTGVMTNVGTVAGGTNPQGVTVAYRG